VFHAFDSWNRVSGWQVLIANGLQGADRVCTMTLVMTREHSSLNLRVRPSRQLRCVSAPGCCAVAPGRCPHHVDAQFRGDSTLWQRPMSRMPPIPTTRDVRRRIGFRVASGEDSGMLTKPCVCMCMCLHTCGTFWTVASVNSAMVDKP
jgi:hypothetical protein